MIMIMIMIMIMKMIMIVIMVRRGGTPYYPPYRFGSVLQTSHRSAYTMLRTTLRRLRHNDE